MADQEWVGWHFLPNDRRLYGNGELPDAQRTFIEAGQTVTLEGKQKPKLCARGFHASRRALDALNYTPNLKGLVICRVRLSGVIIEDTVPPKDKAVASARTVLWMADADPTLNEFACWSAEAVLLGRILQGEAVDPRSWAAVETKRRWLAGRASDSELDAAWEAARGAARGTAREAAWAAWGAANSELERRLSLLAPPTFGEGDDHAA